MKHSEEEQEGGRKKKISNAMRVVKEKEGGSKSCRVHEVKETLI
jgi:hypothetical protein